MKLFRFKLDPLLMLRRSYSARAMEVYSKAMSASREGRRSYEALVVKLSNLNEEMMQRRQAVIDVGKQKEYLDEIKHVREMAYRAKMELEKLEEEEKRELDLYLKAKRDEEVLVKLKEKKSEQHVKDMLKEEEKMLEEIDILKRRSVEITI